VVRPAFDPAIEQRIGRWFDRYHSIRMANFRISDTEMAEGIGSAVTIHPCRTPGVA
jgi:formylmethanofuran dehydrogenase subunit A